MHLITAQEVVGLNPTEVTRRELLLIVVPFFILYTTMYTTSSIKTYLNTTLTAPSNRTKFLYKTGLKKLLIIALRGLEVAELKEEDMPMV